MSRAPCRRGANDAVGLEQLERKLQVFPVKGATRVLVIDQDPIGNGVSVRVRFIDEHDGLPLPLTAWVLRDFLVESSY